MKKFSKYLALALALVMVLGLAACNTPNPPASSNPPADPSASTEPSDSPEPSDTPDADPYAGLQVAMITDIGDIDDKSFNQGTWEGIVNYCEARGIDHRYYKPVEQSDNEYLNSIGQAITNGATIIVTPGFLFEVPIYQAQQMYPDVKFVLIDGNPHDADYAVYETLENTVGIVYAEEQAGFLAGYAAVKDGATKLGFMGGVAVPAVIRFGHGFIQGADHAATEMGISVDMKYTYTNSFSASPEIQSQATSWYSSGTEIIFACGGSIGTSVMNAAEAAGTKVIGVDIDQGGESPTVVNSSIKGLAASVELVLDQYFNGSFPGGQGLVIDASQDGVGLAMDSNRFENFGQADYDVIYAELAANNIDIVGDMNENGETINPADVPALNVTVDVIA